jgi:multiple sugar transport system ATP-binding protein
VARIDLIDICKTLKDREPPGFEVIANAATPASSSARRGRPGSAFAIQNLSLRVPDGQTLVILGPSGCGKTTLLKIIAGLIVPDSGEVRYDGVDVKELTPGERRIGMVFQNYALYPHLSSRTNVLSYFLFRRKTADLDEQARAKYQRTSDLMGVELEYLLDRKPSRLSGGEKQRVALGRCITRDAALFLVDEPFANLDQALREKYRVNLKALLKQFSITTVYVTHDHNEALILADRLAIMDRGRIVQTGTYEEIYRRPANMFVAEFLNLHMGTPPISLVEARLVPHLEAPPDAWIGVRPEDLEVSTERRDGASGGVIAGEERLPMMNALILTIRMGDQELHAYIPDGPGPGVGARVGLTFRRYHVFDRESGSRLQSHPEHGTR